MLKKIFLLIIFIPVCLTAETLVPLSEINFEFLMKEEGQLVLSHEDDFIKSLSAFDRSARLKTDKEVTPEEFKKHITQQVLNWSEEEVEKTGQAVGEAVNLLEKYNLPLPGTIYLIKTTGEEEGQAPYCRGKNAIILPLKKLKESKDEIRETIIHETFHILTRNNPDLQKKLYEILGFKKAKAPLLEDPIAQWKITNPDASSLSWYFEGELKGELSAFIPLLLASSPYKPDRGGEFFHYMRFYLAQVKINEGEMEFVKKLGKYQIMSHTQVPDYMRLIGENTGYIIHPEEVLASNFVLLVTGAENLKTPSIIEEMSALLLKKPKIK